MTEPRHPARAVLTLAVGGAILAYVGCSGGRKDGDDASRPAGESTTTTPDAETEGPEPAAILVLTGQQHGYLEPCGCTEGQSGGLGRRADLMNRLREEGRALVPLDLGGLIVDPASSRAGRDQLTIKLGIGLEALARLDYRAMALSADDLELGLGIFVGEYMNVPDAPPLLATNVEPVEGFEEVFRKVARVEAGPLALGLLAVVDPSAIEALRDPEQSYFFAEVRDPATAIGDALPALEADTDVQVLLVQGTPELAAELAEAHPGLDVVVAAALTEHPPPRPEWRNDGATMLVQVGQKGHHAGLIDLYDSTAEKPRYRRIMLDTKYESAEPITTLVDEVYLERLDRQDVVENYPRHPHPSGARFVGAETCKACHPKTFEKWSTTKHAAAWEAIVSGRRGDRTMDAECVSCHSTGFGFESGFVNVDRTPRLTAQQCENCHGPGSLHVSAPDDAEYRAMMHLEKEEVGRSLCVRCHDAENDPHWDFGERYPVIAHEMLDSYDDPGVHEGLDLGAAAVGE